MAIIRSLTNEPGGRRDQKKLRFARLSQDCSWLFFKRCECDMEQCSETLPEIADCTSTVYSFRSSDYEEDSLVLALVVVLVDNPKMNGELATYAKREIVGFSSMHDQLQSPVLASIATAAFVVFFDVRFNVITKTATIITLTNTKNISIISNLIAHRLCHQVESCILSLLGRCHHISERFH